MIRNFGKQIVLAGVLAAIPAFSAEKRVVNQASTRIVVVYWDMNNKAETVIVEKGATAAITVRSADELPYGIYLIFDKSVKDRTPIQAFWFDQWTTRGLESPVYKVDDKGLSPGQR